MSTWTSRPSRAVAIAAALALVGCGGLGPWTGETTMPAPTEVTVTSARVAVAGPTGFCVDPTATQDRGETAFVLLGNCAAISNSASAGQPPISALLTASISEPSERNSLRDAIPGLDEFFRSDEGLRLLSRTQNPATVTVLNSFHQGEIFFLQARDTSPWDLHGVQQEYWRVYMDVGPRIATLSVLGLEDQDITEEAALATLRSFADRVTEVNRGLALVGAATGEPAASDMATPAPVVPRAPLAARPSVPFWKLGIFRRLFG